MKKFFVMFIVSGFLATIAVLIWLFILYNQIRFNTDTIVNYKPELTTQIFDKNGNLVSNLFDKKHRLYIEYDDIPARVIEALVAVEDTLFFDHNGINFDAILRAIVKDIKAKKFVEGASTITQQLVKNRVLTREKKILRKVKEILLALKVETILTKEEILERYLNEIYLGHGYYGIRTASLGYFRKELSQLNLKEIAILVSLPRAPSFYDPTKNFKIVLSRANNIIFRMKNLGWCNESEYKKAIEFIPKVYDDTLTQNVAPFVVDEVVRELSKTLSDIKTGGYRIDLTIDLKAQKIAQESIKFSYDKIKKRDKKNVAKKLNGAMVVMENSSGKILALVGGVNHSKSSFNRATQSLRQPGSSVKPFIYQTALDLGYAPSSPLVDISRTYRFKNNGQYKIWQPKNYEKDFKGILPLREALVHSRNLATINLVQDIGMDKVYNNLKSFGFKQIPYDLSFSLGNFAVSPLEMSEMYSIFSNYGTKVKPMLIESITSMNGQVIKFDIQKEFITEPKQAYLMISIMRDIVQGGTGRNAKVKGLEIAGKTGTTNKNIDAWFCGYSPNIQAIVWFGNDDNKSMRRLETGGRAAAPAFKKFFTEYLKLHPEMERKFKVPNGVMKSKVNGKTEIFTDISKMPDNEEKLNSEAVIF